MPKKKGKKGGKKKEGAAKADAEEAPPSVEESDPAADAANDAEVTERCNALGVSGQDLQRSGDMEAALSKFEEIQTLSNQVRDDTRRRALLAKCLISISTLHDDLEDYDKALNHLRQARGVAQRDPLIEASMLQQHYTTTKAASGDTKTNAADAATVGGSDAGRKGNAKLSDLLDLLESPKNPPGEDPEVPDLEKSYKKSRESFFWGQKLWRSCVEVTTTGAPIVKVLDDVTTATSTPTSDPSPPNSTTAASAAEVPEVPSQSVAQDEEEGAVGSDERMPYVALELAKPKVPARVKPKLPDSLIDEEKDRPIVDKFAALEVDGFDLTSSQLAATAEGNLLFTEAELKGWVKEPSVDSTAPGQGAVRHIPSPPPRAMRSSRASSRTHGRRRLDVPSVSRDGESVVDAESEEEPIVEEAVSNEGTEKMCASLWRWPDLNPQGLKKDIDGTWRKRWNEPSSVSPSPSGNTPMQTPDTRHPRQSIFAARESTSDSRSMWDTSEAIRKGFVSDWSYSNIELFCTERDLDAEVIRPIVFSKYHSIVPLFVDFAALSAEQDSDEHFFTMDLECWRQLLKRTRVDPMLQDKFDAIFLSITEKHTGTRKLLRYEFLASLVRVVDVIHANSRDTGVSMYERLLEWLSRLPDYEGRQSDAWRAKFLYVAGVEDILQNEVHSSQLKLLFSTGALNDERAEEPKETEPAVDEANGSDRTPEVETPPSVKWTSTLFENWFRDLGLIDSHLTRTIVRQNFARSKPFVVDCQQGITALSTLDYCDFLEVLVRLAGCVDLPGSDQQSSSAAGAVGSSESGQQRAAGAGPNGTGPDSYNHLNNTDGSGSLVQFLQLLLERVRRARKDIV